MTCISFVPSTSPLLTSQIWRVLPTPPIVNNVQHIFMGSQPSTRRSKDGRNRLSYMKVSDCHEKRNPARGNMKRKTPKVLRFAFPLNTKEERKKQRTNKSHSASMLHDESTLYRNQENLVSIFSSFSGWLPNNRFEKPYPSDRSRRYYLRHETVKRSSSQHFSIVTPTYRSIARDNSVVPGKNQLGITTVSSHIECHSIAPMPPVLRVPLLPSLPLIHSYRLKPKNRTLESRKLPACQSTGNTKQTVHRGHRPEVRGPPEPFTHESSLPVRSSQDRHRDHRPSISNKGNSHHRSKSRLENCNDRGEQRTPRTSKVSFALAKTVPTGRYESVEVKRRHIYVSSFWARTITCDDLKFIRTSMPLNVRIHISDTITNNHKIKQLLEAQNNIVDWKLVNSEFVKNYANPLPVNK